MATTLAALLTSCRILSGDGTLDNYMRSENCLQNDSPVDGVNKTFFVNSTPIAPGGTISVRVDNSLLAPSAYTVTEPVGQIVMSVAPTTSVYVSYYYYLFPDAVWTEFAAAALEALNLSSGVPATDVPLVPEGLLSALKTYTSTFFCWRVAKQTGLWYNQRLQERVEDRDSISKKWQLLGDSQMKMAIEMRDQYYSGAGANFKPSMRIVEHQPLPWTPSR